MYTYDGEIQIIKSNMESMLTLPLAGKFSVRSMEARKMTSEIEIFLDSKKVKKSRNRF